MTIEEIYNKLASHMIQGMMIHEQLANYYDFLGLKGYKRCHEYHYMNESCMYRKLCRYYINHHNKLIEESEFDNPNIIPKSWYNYTRQDVDTNTKRNAVKQGLEKWVEWEKETKKLYENMYMELQNIGEIASAEFISCFVRDVDRELKKAERYHLNKQATDYDISNIIMEQNKKHNKYKNKTMYIGEKLC